MVTIQSFSLLLPLSPSDQEVREDEEEDQKPPPHRLCPFLDFMEHQQERGCKRPLGEDDTSYESNKRPRPEANSSGDDDALACVNMRAVELPSSSSLPPHHHQAAPASEAQHGPKPMAIEPLPAGGE